MSKKNVVRKSVRQAKAAKPKMKVGTTKPEVKVVKVNRGGAVVEIKGRKAIRATPEFREAAPIRRAILLDKISPAPAKNAAKAAGVPANG